MSNFETMFSIVSPIVDAINAKGGATFSGYQTDAARF